MTGIFRVAVMSDIHAGELAHKDTWVIAGPPDSEPKENPLRDLVDFVEASGLKADLLVTPGDLGNRAHDGGRVYGWRELQTISAELGTDGVVGTAGNHDVVTRSPTPDQAQFLKLLTPRFPTLDENAANSYWREGFYLDDRDARFRILNINTCADFPQHPGPNASEAEAGEHVLAVERGSISTDRLRAIRKQISALVEKPVNIAILHHHPVEHARRAYFRDTYGPAANGDALIQLLEDATGTGRWMIIHGHKHIPDFTVDGGTAHSPLVLCAGSLGGKLWHPINTFARNQFHIVEFELERILGRPRTRGVVHSWSWSYGTGWRKAPPETGLPAEFGFGSPHDPVDLADQVASILNREGSEFARWRDVVESIPLVAYIGHKDFDLFTDRLSSLDFELEYSASFKVTRVSRRVVWT
jgi:Calcineurin-like phosphoesterase